MTNRDAGPDTSESERLQQVVDAYLAAIGQVAAAYDEFRDFSIPSALTASKEGTYDGSHYSRAVNARVLAGLMAKESDLAADWRKEDVAAITALYHQRLAQFMETTTAIAPRRTRQSVSRPIWHCRWRTRFPEMSPSSAASIVWRASSPARNRSSM
jgi:hypothetical protein